MEKNSVAGNKQQGVNDDWADKKSQHFTSSKNEIRHSS